MRIGRSFLVIASVWLLVLPAALFGLYSIDDETGLIWLFLHQLYYAPFGTWLRQLFFVPDSDVGFWVQPIGRVLTAASYALVLFGLRAAFLTITGKRRG